MKNDSMREIQCSNKEEYIAHIKRGVIEFAEQTVDTEEVFGAFCVIDVGDSTQVLQLGNPRSLHNIQQHVADMTARGRLTGAARQHKLAKFLITLGLGVLIGMMI